MTDAANAKVCCVSNTCKCIRPVCPALQAFQFGNLNDRSLVCAKVLVQATTFIWKVRQRWNKTPMAWSYRPIAKLPRCGQPKSIAVNLNGPSLFIFDPEKFAKVICDSFSGCVVNPKVPNNPIGFEFDLCRSPIFEGYPRCCRVCHIYRRPSLRRRASCASIWDPAPGDPVSLA